MQWFGSAQSLVARAGLPQPISIPASQAWLGNDGSWSTFRLGYGTPPQFLQVLISTSAPQPWVVLEEGCAPGPNLPSFQECEELRGGIFYPNASSTIDVEGNYTLEAQTNLGISENGSFFLDTVTLGIPGTAAGSYNLSNQIIAGIAAKQFYIPTWGIRPAATNLTTLNNQYPSLLSNLKDENQLPSLSWGYTAGANDVFQSNQQTLGSLTLGGYDAERFEPHDTVFDFSPDVSRDLVVGLMSITASGNNGSTEMLDTPINAFIDTTVSHMWLDRATCDRFQESFHLSYIEDLDLYLVNRTAHASLVTQNASFTFQLRNNIADDSLSPPVNVTIPYAAFDLNITSAYPGVNQSYPYFPLRRAANSTQHTLGRVFMQYAYLVADYERRTFSVHQALFPDNGQSSIQTIEPLTRPGDNDGRSGLGAGPIAAIVIGAIVILAAAVGATWWLCCGGRTRYGSSGSGSGSSWGSKTSRFRRQQPLSNLEAEIDGSEKTPPGELHAIAMSKQELAASGGLDGGYRELDGDQAAKQELLGSAPEVHEMMDGRYRVVHELPTGEARSYRRSELDGRSRSQRSNE